MLNNRYVKIALVVGTLTALLLAVYAYAAGTAITLGGLAGSGEQTIGGFIVNSYSFTQDADPTYISSWKVTLNTAATTVKSRLGTSGSASAWTADCVNTSTTLWTCTPLVHVLMTEATSLQVSAVYNEP